MEMLNDRGRFVHFTLRTSLALKDEIDKEARLQNTNLNSLCNQILWKHVSFDRITNQLESISLSKPLFIRMLGEISPERMEAIGAELGPVLVKEAFIFLNLEYDIDNLIKRYFEPVSAYSRWYNFSCAGSDRNRKLIFEHSYGKVWSAFLKRYTVAVVKEVHGIEPSVTTNDRLIAMSLH